MHVSVRLSIAWQHCSDDLIKYEVNSHDARETSTVILNADQADAGSLTVSSSGFSPSSLNLVYISSKVSSWSYNARTSHPFDLRGFPGHLLLITFLLTCFGSVQWKVLNATLTSFGETASSFSQIKYVCWLWGRYAQLVLWGNSWKVYDLKLHR